MATYGITPGFATLLLSSVNNTRPRVSIVCAQLHDGNPGPLGTSNPSAVTARGEMTLTTPDSGAISLTGGSPSWEIESGETLSAISLWSGFDGDSTAICLFTLPIAPGVTVAQGDLVILNTCLLEWQPAAQGLWNPVGMVEAPAATATATAGAASVSAGTPNVTITAPTAAATGSASAPTLVVLTLITAPSATATGHAPAPAVSGSAGITAPSATATGSASAPTVSIFTVKYVLQQQLNVSVMHAATW